MPFTPCHAAAVLPFTRTPLVPSALVIGSMAPDIVYYLPTPWAPLTTHSPRGAVTVDLVVGLVLYLLWHALLARPALAAAPASLAARVPAAALVPWWRRVLSPVPLLLAAGSVVVGSLTHWGWDEFTHHGRWGTRHVAWLAQVHGSLPGFKWAQYASGVVGGVLLAVWCVRWWRRTPPVAAADGVPAPSRRLAWAAWVLVLGVGVARGTQTGAHLVTGPAGPRWGDAGFVGATTGAVAAGLTALVLALLWHLLPRPAPADPSAGPDC